MSAQLAPHLARWQASKAAKRAYMRQYMARKRAAMYALGLSATGRPLIPVGWRPNPRPGYCPRCGIAWPHGLCAWCVAELATEQSPQAA